jgi:hypothetical protein
MQVGLEGELADQFDVSGGENDDEDKDKDKDTTKAPAAAANGKAGSGGGVKEKGEEEEVQKDEAARAPQLRPGVQWTDPVVNAAADVFACSPYVRCVYFIAETMRICYCCNGEG